LQQTRTNFLRGSGAAGDQYEQFDLIFEATPPSKVPLTGDQQTTLSPAAIDTIVSS
jgi:hypothetical protein